MKIGRLAEKTGTNPPTIRYYEKIGLLPVPPRPAGSQRAYDDADARRLTFIRRCRDFGFPIGKVRQMTTLMEATDRSCLEARDLAAGQLEEVRRRLVELRELEKSIAAFVDGCDSTCLGGAGADCVIIGELSGPPGTKPCPPISGGCGSTSTARNAKRRS